MSAHSLRKQAQPAEAGLAAKAPLTTTPSIFNSVPSVISQSQFPALLSWAAQSASASLTTPRGAFDSIPTVSSSTSASAPAVDLHVSNSSSNHTDNNSNNVFPFDFAELQPVASATFGGSGAPAAQLSSSVASRLRACAGAGTAVVGDGALGTADLLSLADTLALGSILPAQRSGSFVAAAADLPLTQSLVLGGLQPTPSFIALGAAAGVSAAAEEDDGESDASSTYYHDDDVMSLSSSLIDLSGMELPATRSGRLVLTKEQARAAAKAEGKRKRRAKVAVPDEKKDEKYWRRREKNNEAARRNRMMKKAMEGAQKDRLPELNHEKARLTDEVALLRAELKGLVTLLRDQLVQEGMSVDHAIFS